MVVGIVTLLLGIRLWRVAVVGVHNYCERGGGGGAQYSQRLVPERLLNRRDDRDECRPDEGATSTCRSAAFWHICNNERVAQEPY